MANKIPITSASSDISSLLPCGSFLRFCEIYLPQAPQIFTYGIAFESSIQRGSVVWVQLGNRKATLGLVAKVHTNAPAFDVKEAVAHASNYVFDERYMEILEWTARYYLSIPNRALFVFWPNEISKYLDVFFSRQGQDISLEVPKRLENSVQPPLTNEQSLALDKLIPLLDTEGFRGALLHGVTGSGKTRVYLELAQRAIAQGKRVLILVPEIGLTPQTAARFSSFLGFDVPILHSALSAPRKREIWLSLLENKAQIVLGTRSAILTPFPFDLVILDEEHDSSYKQQDPSPRYHCRELAFHIAHKYGALVVLGSATPSMESFENARAGHLLYLTLTKRATEMKLPKIHVVDMHRKAPLQQSGLLLSSELREALSTCLQQGNQAIVLLNRRGFSKARVCADCGATLHCKDCHIPLVYHKQHNGLLCHYCGRLYPLNTPCADCGCEDYELVGGAIEKLEEEILEWIPNATLVRMDRDTTQNIGAAEKILTAFRDREYSILLGTQMVAKGHDFPHVQLVGVVGADSGTGSPDFRTGERLFQLLSQTAGRAGRAEEGAQVIFQTQNPEDPIVRFALTHNYSGFAQLELSERSEALYPPFCKLAAIEMGCRDEKILKDAAESVASKLSKAENIQLLGPVDAYIPMVQKIFWVHFLVKAKSASAIREALSDLLSKPEALGVPRNVEVRLDMDPQ